MRIRLLPSAAGGDPANQYLTSFLVDDRLGVDAGSLGIFDGPEAQRRVDHVLVTHAHMDHIATLPVFVETRRTEGGEAVTIHAPGEVVRVLRDHVFNDALWPDYARFEAEEGGFVRWSVLSEEVPTRVGDHLVTAVRVDHQVPACGYVVDDGRTAVVFGGDSGPTDRLWAVARATGRLRAAFVECSFPDALRDLALRVGHLTPALLAGEMEKLPPGTETVVVHLKPKFRRVLLEELAGLVGPRLRLGVPGETLDVPPAA